MVGATIGAPDWRGAGSRAILRHAERALLRSWRAVAPGSPEADLPVLTKDYPDHHDAELVLKLYELRRESVMRESRNQILANFHPVSADDVIAVTRLDHPLNAAWRQVNTYWEMVYAMARHGVMHADFMLESNGEGLFLYAKIEPWLAELRAQVNPLAFRNAEWVATETEMGRLIVERYRARVRALMNRER